jgi:hypothetical protein
MKKKVAIIFSGQMRTNSLNPNFTHDDIILDSIKKNFLNEEFKSHYDYDVFISTDVINIKKAFQFFGDNLQNINITESFWYMENIEDKPHDYSYYHDKYLNNIANYFNDYSNHIHILYMYYRMYCAYKMTQHHQKKTNTHYDYFVKLRPDSRLMQNIHPIFKLLENSNKCIFTEHDHLFICKKELRDIFNLVECYGTYKQHIDKKKAIYLYYTAGEPLYSDNIMRLCPEKQVADHIYYTLLKQNLNFCDAVYGVKYPSFHLLYRENLTYAYSNHSDENIFNAIQDVNFIKKTFYTYMEDFEKQYPISQINVLFVNHKIKKCGVYQYGVRLYNILKKSMNINFTFGEIENYEEYTRQLSLCNYDLIFYNYHPDIMWWLNVNNIQRKVKNIGLQHDLAENDIFDITLRLDTTLPERKNRYNFQRPIFENIDELLKDYKPLSTTFNDFVNYSEGDVPIFGSFGFAFNRKCFDKIVKVVCDNYDNAIIKLILTYADTIPPDQDIDFNCYKNLTKPGVKLIITHEFVEEIDILYFLNSNTMNIFLYETHPSAGVSSVTDYALSVKKPIAISNASWFRHIYSDDICVDKTNIKDIMEKSNKVCDKYRDIFSNKNLITTIDNIILNNI